jgi:Zonular occludens toxin (Zot)
MIKAYVGLQGSGKTLNMVRDLMDQLRMGRKVISNTPIMFYENGVKYQSVTIGDSKEFERAVINSFNCTLAIDEASIFFPSTFFNKMKPEHIYKFAQSRKMRTDLFYTTQGFGHTIKRLRDNTNWVVSCHRRKFILPLEMRLRKHLYNEETKETKTIFSPRIRRPYIYIGRLYNPDFFGRHILDPKKKRMFIINEWKIYPSEAKRLFQAYNTFFMVKGSALTEIKNIEADFRAEEFAGDNSAFIKEGTTIDQDESFDDKSYDNSALS